MPKITAFWAPFTVDGVKRLETGGLIYAFMRHCSPNGRFVDDADRKQWEINFKLLWEELSARVPPRVSIEEQNKTASDMPAVLLLASQRTD